MTSVAKSSSTIDQSSLLTKLSTLLALKQEVDELTSKAKNPSSSAEELVAIAEKMHSAFGRVQQEFESLEKDHEQLFTAAQVKFRNLLADYQSREKAEKGQSSEQNSSTAISAALQEVQKELKSVETLGILKGQIQVLKGQFQNLNLLSSTHTALSPQNSSSPASPKIKNIPEKKE